MYSVIQIANFFIEKHLRDKERPIDPIKLQKLIYISYGWYWALLGRELFEDEIQAWKYGPVIPAVWRAFKDQGHGIEKISNIQPPLNDLDESTKNVLEAVYEVYVSKESGRIVAITHAPGTPWSLVYDGTRNKKIHKDSICRYYELLYEERKNNIRK